MESLFQHKIQDKSNIMVVAKNWHLCILKIQKEKLEQNLYKKMPSHYLLVTKQIFPCQQPTY